MKTAARALLLVLLAFELGNLWGAWSVPLSFTWLGLVVTLSAVLAAIELTAFGIWRWKKQKLSPRVWLYALMALSIDVFGDIFHWYDRFSWYDQIAHFAASAFIFLIIREIYLAWHPEKKVTRWHLPVCIGSLALTLGLLYEIEEAVEDVLTGSNRSGGFHDTTNDLLMDLLGILFALSITVLVRWKKSPHTASHASGA